MAKFIFNWAIIFALYFRIYTAILIILMKFTFAFIWHHGKQAFSHLKPKLKYVCNGGSIDAGF
ncbi:hypothetical protein CSQ88_08735 [Iodobacter sp. BJB302]|nr:hypothetical protein CSQ88_08735 [Iodobacter sp. BJB302]